MYKFPQKSVILRSVRVSLLGGLLVACTSVPPARSPDVTSGGERVPEDQIRWPAQYRPEEASFFVHNQIDIDAPAEDVWNVIIQAETWPAWYEGASDVKIVRGGKRGALDDDAEFSWKTMGLDFVSQVIEFQPPFRLSWESRKSTIQGYHAWLIVPSGTGSRLVTEESQHGFMTFLQKVFVPKKLHRLHEKWLSQIKKKAEAERDQSEPQGAVQ
jgi:uncharacterized protein YndB with AHSA1/START domain